MATAAAAVLLLSLQAAAWGSYRSAQQQQQLPPHDSPAELHQLHHEPSPHFCALPPPLVCAHGGDAAAAPPNTLEALQAALDGGATCVELDVSRTADGRLVALHTRELAELLALAGGQPAASAAAPAAAPAAAGAARSGGGGTKQGAGQAGGPPQVGDYGWAQLAALRWRGGQRVTGVEAALRLLVPATEHITLDVKVALDEVRGFGGCLMGRCVASAA